MKSGEFGFVRAVLNLFGAAPNLSDKNFPNYTLDNEKNLANGFFITENAFKACPCVADKKILRYLQDRFGYNVCDLNRGFYKSFGAVSKLSQERILANKLLHYMTTYGMENFGIFDRELVYIPNDALNLPENAKPVKITVIDSIEISEVETRVNRLIQSGAALSEETLNSVVAVITFLKIEPNIEDLPNKELAIRLCELLNILPKKPEQFLRYMIYLCNGSTLLIKNEDTIDAVKNSCKGLDEYFSRYIERNGLGKLASIFYRFKPIWLAFKHHSKYLRSTINKMRRLAEHWHKPLEPKLLERLTSARQVDIDELKRELGKITVYRKASLANAILYRQNSPESIAYHIRNGKIFADDYRGNLKFDAQEILDVIIDSIAEDIAPNVRGKRIYIPARFNYAVPVSEKKFVGNIPCGSSYTFASNSVVFGVHWFNILYEGQEVRVDLDLHLNSTKRDIGWQNDFRDENFINTREEKVIFSGDMTDAPIDGGGATEAFFVGETVADELIMVNLNHYNRIAGDVVPFKLVLADVSHEKINRQYLLDAHEIAFCVPNEISSGEMFIGCLNSDESGAKTFYFNSANTGNRIVARSNDLTTKITSATRKTFESALGLNDVLHSAGAVLEGVTAEDCDINLDPAEITKDTLLGLLAK